MRRDLRRSLVWPPTQSKAGYEARTGSLGLYPVGSWRIPQKETTAPWGEMFSLCPAWPTLSIYTLCVSCPPTLWCCEEHGPSSGWPPHKYGGAAARSPEAFSAPSWTNPGPFHVYGISQTYVWGKGECILMPTKPYEKQSEKQLLRSHILIQSNSKLKLAQNNHRWNMVINVNYPGCYRNLTETSRSCR